MRNIWNMSGNIKRGRPNIVLVGMMGSGKTTVGQLLSKMLNKEFIDIDQFVEKKANKSIQDIFAREGERAFRRLEAQIVVMLADKRGLVISTGGGVVLDWENIEILQRDGLIIFLNASPEVIAKRLRDDDTRPLIKANLLKTLKEIFAKRINLYQRAADIVLDVDPLTPEQIAGEIIKLLESENL